MKRPIRRRRSTPSKPSIEALEGRLLMATVGSPDPSFGVKGFTTLPIVATNLNAPNPYDLPDEGAQAVAFQSEGKTVVASNSLGATSSVAVLRFNVDGSPDTSFGKAGVAMVAPVQGTGAAQSIAIQPDGKILIGGYVLDVTEGEERIVARLNSDGSPDSTFGTDGTGVVTLGVGAEPAKMDDVSSILLGPGGTILLAGDVASGGFAVTRLKADGSIDTSFGSGGQAVVPIQINGVDSVHDDAATLQADGKIVLAGAAAYEHFTVAPGQTVDFFEIAAARLNADGSLDTSFGGSAASAGSAPGTVVLPPAVNPGGDTDASAQSVAIRSDGKILLAGIDGFKASIIQLNADGTPDLSFGSTGGRDLLTSAPGATAVAQFAPDGKVIVVVGNGTSDTPDPNYLLRLNPDGSSDATFGPTSTPGQVTIDAGSNFIATSLAIRPDGKIVVAGSDVVAEPKSRAGQRAITGLGQFVVVSRAVPGDYNGDGVADPAVYLATAGSFAIRPSGGGPDQIIPFGAPGVGQTIPAPADYTGSGETEIGVYLPSQGVYAYRPAGGGADVVEAFGIPGAGQSIPAPADYLGTGQADVAVYLPSIAAFGIRNPKGGPDSIVPFGIAGPGQTIPAPGDYFGSGQADIAAYLPSIGAFAIRNPAGGADQIIPFGLAGLGKSIPIPGDYDGSDKTELAVYIPSLGLFAYRPANGGADVLTRFGAAGDGTLPVPGDYTGSGKTEIAVYDPNYASFAYRPANGGADVIFSFGSPGAGQSLPAATPSGDLSLFSGAAASSVAGASLKIAAARVPSGPVFAASRTSLARIAQTPTSLGKTS